MSDTFGADYADVYDRLYADKDYRREVDLIESVARELSPTARVLDLGCGTGNHAIEVARRGFSVTGVDLSAEMVRVAAAKAERAGVALDLHVGDIVDVDAGEGYDVVTIMFAVLGYLTETDRLLAGFRNARRHLRVGGKLVFDVWYGPAVLATGPSERSRVVPQDDGSIIRMVRPALHEDRDVVDVDTRMMRTVGDRVVFDVHEVHVVRYFFLPELRYLLGEAGFDVDSFYEFPDRDVPPGPDSWNVGCIATAR